MTLFVWEGWHCQLASFGASFLGTDRITYTACLFNNTIQAPPLETG